MHFHNFTLHPAIIALATLGYILADVAGGHLFHLGQTDAQLIAALLGVIGMVTAALISRRRPQVNPSQDRFEDEVYRRLDTLETHVLDTLAARQEDDWVYQLTTHTRRDNADSNQHTADRDNNVGPDVLSPGFDDYGDSNIQ